MARHTGHNRVLLSERNARQDSTVPRESRDPCSFCGVRPEFGCKHRSNDNG